MFFINATNWRKDIAEQILNNDAVMIIDKNKYQQLIGQHQQLLFDNKQILRLVFLLSIAFFCLHFTMYRFFPPNGRDSAKILKLWNEKFSQKNN